VDVEISRAVDIVAKLTQRGLDLADNVFNTTSCFRWCAIDGSVER
jgi:hypothetical protein